jgi:hypothetical protein
VGREMKEDRLGGMESVNIGRIFKEGKEGKNEGGRSKEN